ncbi:MAG: hypothetical protein HYY04_01800 [Chloroflexi bacterium]|nr:hypothetical protein [Chloroflexota bacterium]
METIFLACFLFGALFTILSFGLGFAGSALHGHTGDIGAGDHGGLDASAGQWGHVGPLHGHDVGTAPHADHGDSATAGRLRLPLLNVSSLLAFLTWFGAAGYLLLRFAAWPPLAAVGGGVIAGGVAGVLIALLLAGLRAGEQEMDPRDYRLDGTIARVTAGIPAEGVGEIVFTKAGSRRSEAARSIDGRPVARGTEVVIIDYSRGVAQVQPWDEFTARTQPGAPERPTSVEQADREASADES